jgi:RimJ/RimL family protein N-acetyltransferase
MKRLSQEETATLKDWFLPERPGPVIGAHVINTNNGACFVDRWPAPRVVLAETAGNYTLLGDAEALTLADAQEHLNGFVKTSEPFVPLLKAAFSDFREWERVIFAPESAAAIRNVAVAEGYTMRRLEPSDTWHLQNTGMEVSWISKTWGGASGLAASGYAWGAFADGQLASVACTFFLGVTYEEVGVATDPTFRGAGLSTACASALCADIVARGHLPSWSTSLDNGASIRVAEKLGFTIQRYDSLYVVGRIIPPTS